MLSARDPGFEARVRASFARQQFMTLLGARLERVVAGEVCIRLPFQPALTQQHGFLHAGVVTSVVDSACGYAALTLMEPGAAVLSVEFKVNLLAPARGREFVAVGRVVRAGRTLTVCTGEVRALPEGEGGDEVPVAIMQATIMAVRERGGLSD
ncbi:PaaI family thioesterase [Roseisolibacter agri]|uniref:Thioesterase n=1 Tax=Roseisolibacter agri TaxID=2014610 RepID=A0AA37Q6M4_9BACT|nr:PaaI family thioesterase [Roseisolibacter agri]GLC24692.1 thioesterase [Roseisolibacter agri]